MEVAADEEVEHRERRRAAPARSLDDAARRRGAQPAAPTTQRRVGRAPLRATPPRGWGYSMD